MILLAAGAFGALAAAFAGGAWWMWWRNEVRGMRVGSVDLREEDEAKQVGEQTYRDRVMFALPPERTTGPTEVYDWATDRELTP